MRASNASPVLIVSPPLPSFAAHSAGRKLQTLQKYRDDPDWKPQTKYLFHGTGRTEPSVIYNGDIGFDMRYSDKGMWGESRDLLPFACSYD